MNTTVVEYIRGINIIKAFNKSASSYDKFVNAVEGNKNSMLDWYLSICFYMTAAMEILPSTLIFVLPTSLFLFMKELLMLRNFNHVRFYYPTLLINHLLRL